MGIPCVTDALTRLHSQGLDRHDAIHAIASALSGEMFDAVQSNAAVAVNPSAAYERAMSALTAGSWRASAGP